MGNFSSWSYTSKITFWPVTLDQFSQPQTGEPYTVNGTWTVGGKAQRDPDGVEFVPGATIYFESTDAQAPKIQWQVAAGEHTGNPPQEAELVRQVRAYDVSQFEGGSLVDRVVFT